MHKSKNTFIVAEKYRRSARCRHRSSLATSRVGNYIGSGSLPKAAVPQAMSCFYESDIFVILLGDNNKH